jgi:hypothetical protein
VRGRFDIDDARRPKGLSESLSALMRVQLLAKDDEK